jgi:hypothetical protein
MITAEDMLRHQLPDSPQARESLMWSNCLPDEGLFINPYIWVGGDGVAGRAFIMTEAGREEMLMLDIEQGIELEGDFDAFEVAGIKVEQPEALRTAKISFASERCRFEYRFTGMHEPFDYGSNRDGCPWYMAHNRYEQAGLGEGRLEIDGRVVEFSGTAHHDHSWGVRDWDAMQHYKWIAAQTDNGEAGLNYMMTYYRGEPTVNGYVYKEGVSSAIVDGSMRCTYDDRFITKTATAELLDEAGRTTVVETEAYADFAFPASETSVILGAISRATVDGQPGVAQFDSLWPVAYVEHQREIAQAHGR